jgi:hypothetical protein
MICAECIYSASHYHRCLLWVLADAHHLQSAGKGARLHQAARDSVEDDGSFSTQVGLSILICFTSGQTTLQHIVQVVQKRQVLYAVLLEGTAGKARPSLQHVTQVVRLKPVLQLLDLPGCNCCTVF